MFDGQIDSRQRSHEGRWDGGEWHGLKQCMAENHISRRALAPGFPQFTNRTLTRQRLMCA